MPLRLAQRVSPSRTWTSMAVQDIVAHILFHVNAEASDSDPSQVPGVARRAQYVRSAVAGLRSDSRDLDLDTILAAISAAAPSATDRSAFLRMIENQRTVGETRPQLAIQAWVGQAVETRG